MVHTGATGEPGHLGWPWAPVSCPLAGGSCDLRPSWPLQGPRLVPPGRGGCPASSGRPCLWSAPWTALSLRLAGTATWGSSCSHRWGTQACRRLLMGTHSHVHMSRYGNTHTVSYISLWVATHLCLIMGTHTRLLTASRPCPAWTHTQTHTSLWSTDPDSLGFELPFHLGVSPRIQSPSRAAPPPWPCWPAPAPRGQASPWIRHRLASPASSS